MPKYSSKVELITDCETEWEKLWQLLDGVDEKTMTKRMGKGSSARSIVDHLAHLYVWHRLLLSWFKTDAPDLPAKGYKWSQTREMNQAFFEEFKNEQASSVIRKLKLSHGRALKLTKTLSQKAILEPGNFPWTGKLPAASYIAPNMASHYRWAQKKIKKMLK